MARTHKILIERRDGRHCLEDVWVDRMWGADWILGAQDPVAVCCKNFGFHK